MATKGTTPTSTNMRHRQVLESQDIDIQIVNGNLTMVNAVLYTSDANGDPSGTLTLKQPTTLVELSGAAFEFGPDFKELCFDCGQILTDEERDEIGSRCSGCFVTHRRAARQVAA